MALLEYKGYKALAVSKVLKAHKVPAVYEEEQVVLHLPMTMHPIMQLALLQVMEDLRLTLQYQDL